MSEQSNTPENPETPESSATSATSAKSYTISRFPETLAVVRLPAGAEIPEWAESSSIFSITATATETSLVCAGRSVPKKARHAKPYTAFCVEGPLDLGEPGVLVSLLTPLAAEGLPVFTLSTYDTDWILVRTAQADRAEEAWRRSGHTVAPAVPA
ncbi:ACT domain-containing protein [Nocardioides sp. zg-ZUI104]|uniref:ACT domain-containing protein n=1 Tax=Nocardioides faecalis TaxID=2803858 RepID=UPI001BCCC052|nr:ACT domain-containing protein [Nocardioides faecalis]MBS4754288.1 ACT domain-containing protein [Nocardioides faecalis]